MNIKGAQSKGIDWPGQVNRENTAIVTEMINHSLLKHKKAKNPVFAWVE